MMGSRILVVAPEPFYEDRGTPICVRQVLEALLHLGHTVDLLTYPVGHDLAMPGLSILRSANPLSLRRVPIGFSWRKLVLDGPLAVRLRSLLRARPYDCVHALEESAFPAAYFGRKYGKKVIYDMHSSMVEQLGARMEFRLVQPWLERMERWLLRSADAVVCSGGLSARVREIAPEVRPKEWRFAPASSEVLEETVSRLREDLGLAPDDRVVLYSGTFETYQGIPLLLDAARTVLHDDPSAVLVLVGLTPGDGASVRADVNALLPEARVRLVDRQPRNRLAAYLSMADVVVSPRTYGGNIPLKIFDYLAAGRPIVATDLPTHRGLLNGERARLVSPSAPALAAGILDVLQDRPRADAMAGAAREYADRTLGWRAFVRDVEDLYRKVGIVPATGHAAG
ncbi:MAG: glycosyltransferase family 4 protein [Gemmatimonadales bacterium]